MRPIPPVAEAHTASEAVRNWFGSEVRPIPPVAEAICQSWEFDPWALAMILILGVIYVGGWRRVHRQMPHRFGAARLAAFLAGLAALVVPGRNNPSLYAVNGRPVYVHLNGLAIVRLK